MKKTALSGCQVTGALHLGNYLGAIVNWSKIQDEYNCLFFLADLHAITIDRSPIELNSSILQTVAIYIATGLVPEKTTIFAQSMVKEHVELAWILNCVTPLGWLKRMTQFKDKVGKDQETAGLGLLSYPVLMAADILLYNADVVPVGDDQKQHLELTRDIAAIINRKFNRDILKLPEPLIQGSSRIMSLKDGRKKMSKSDPSDLSRINLNDSRDQIYQKIKKAKTDHLSEISYDPQNRPEISNLIDIYCSLSGANVDKIVDQYQNAGFAKFKDDLADIIITTLTPINTKYIELIKNQDYLITTLHNGADKARITAAKTLIEVKKLMGFVM
ncbi:MAG: tryptophan--tRNA ligase [Rickettsia endosymbiont of Pseudomimeciton antennatum]|nr:tryptophan--tRNA ligase [Rickettsia endosymbiont of Pseudomimeciton antennatum]MCC8397880.1 tryptophan--tRNA ligase [Rickettsia endosymbiont of Labidopullus appendiculatus]